MDGFLVPAQNAEYEFTEKRSRFIGHIFKIESAENATEILSHTKKQYWDANHNVYAYILSDGTERFSDDGEPQGTAGMPVLSVLRGKNVKNVLCIVTRYFGGVLLGTGGLVRAYTQGAQGALENAGLARLTPFFELTLSCDYTFIDPLRRLFPKINIIENGCNYGQNVVFSLLCEPCFLENAEKQITEMSKGTLKMQKISEKLIEKRL